MDLKDKVILITGASGGIGAATAQRLAGKGMALALAGRDTDKLNAVAEACRKAGAAAEIYPGEITDPDYIAGLGDAVAARFGALHVLFNNAGIFETGAFDKVDMARWDAALDINFRSLLHLTQAVLPRLLEHRESAVVNLSSIAGRTTFGGGGIYSATKHAVHAFSGCLFEDLRDRGLKVAAIYPGFVDTGMTAAIAGERANMIHPDDVAQTVEFVLQFPANACPTEIVIRPQFPL
ncbi:MAG: SDR family oxidoreductase [Paracoccaceae bacterium]